MKVNLQGKKCTDTPMLSPKTCLVSLKIDSDDLDVDKLKPAPVDLSKLSNG